MKTKNNFKNWVIETYIKEDWSTITSIGKFFLYPAWFIRSVGTWIISPLFIPIYMLETSKFYNKLKEEMEKNPNGLLPF